MSLIIRILGPCDGEVLNHVAPGVFDNPIDPRWTAEFLADPRHHLAVAIDEDLVIGIASAVHYVHPDKAPQLWINEVGVADDRRNQGIGRRLVQALLDRGLELGCREAWVGTEFSNASARRMYQQAGGKEPLEPFLMVEFRIPSDE